MPKRKQTTPTPQPTPTPPGYEPESILEEAHRLTTRDRRDDYGDPVEDLGGTARAWTWWIAEKNRDRAKPITLNAQDVAIMMALLKLRREATKHKRDNLVDAAGYISIANGLVIS